jgi:hypothetical protein
MLETSTCMISRKSSLSGASLHNEIQGTIPGAVSEGKHSVDVKWTTSVGAHYVQLYKFYVAK